MKLPFWTTRCQYWGVHLPKLCSSAKFVYWYSSHLCSINWGVHWPKKVCLINMNTLLNYFYIIFSVIVFKKSILVWGSIGQSRFVCQVWCSGIQGIYSWFTGGGSICQSMFICQILCTGIQGFYGLLMGGPLAKVGLSAKFGVAVFKASMLNSLGGQLAKVGLSAKFCTLVFKASMLH